MRKNGLALLVSCCLLMALLPALAQGGAVLPPAAGNITSLAVHKGEVLLTTEEGQVFALKEGESEPQALPWQLKGLRDILIFEGDQLYGLNLWAGELYPVSIEGDRIEMGETIGLDFGELSDQEAVHNISNAFVLGGQLYLVIAQTYSISLPSLLVIDVSTGKAQAHDIEGLMYATPYREGQLASSSCCPAWRRCCCPITASAGCPSIRLNFRLRRCSCAAPCWAICFRPPRSRCQGRM